MLLQQPIVPAKFICYELHLRNGAVLAEHRTKEHLRKLQRIMREKHGTYTEIHKKTNKGYTFME